MSACRLVYITGRSRYGLGMEDGSVPVSEQLEIVTKKLGETTEYTVSIDVEQALPRGTTTFTSRRSKDCRPDTHYTRVEITNLNRRPAGSHPRKDQAVSGGNVPPGHPAKHARPAVENPPLEASMTCSSLRIRSASEYREGFDFTVNGKKAWGWVGVLDVGGRPKAGFAIVHQDPHGPDWPDAWHPESLYGQTKDQTTS